MMRTILRGMLRGKEYEVIGKVRNGIAAVDIADRLKPDIVCLDVVMPKKDSLTALCEIKTARPETEVVVITSNAARVLDTLEINAGRLHPKPV